MTSERSDFDRLSQNSMLSRDAILKHKNVGNIVIDPYRPEKVKTASYDVSLGEWYFSNQNGSPSEPMFLYNGYDELTVRNFWGRPQFAKEAWEVFGSNIPTNVKRGDKVIVFRPGELILAHTQEFIGGRNCVTTMMKARSSMGRSGITVCKCAGWGDVGYINRWTMEIQNELPVHNFLMVGEAIAQIAFFQVDPIEGDYALEKGKYQTETDLGQLKKHWHPDQMLAKLWMDKQK